MSKKENHYDCRNSILLSGMAITAVMMAIPSIFKESIEVNFIYFVAALFPISSSVAFWLFHDPDVKELKWREPTTPYDLKNTKPIRVGVIPGPIVEIYQDKITASEAAKYLRINPSSYNVHLRNGKLASMTMEKGNNITSDLGIELSVSFNSIPRDDIFATRGEIMFFVRRTEIC